MPTKSEKRNFAKRINGITMPLIRRRSRIGRNEVCPCGSDLKYKKCCLGHIEVLDVVDGNSIEKDIPENIQTMILEYEAEKEAKEKAEKEAAKAAKTKELANVSDTNG